MIILVMHNNNNSYLRHELFCIYAVVCSKIILQSILHNTLKINIAKYIAFIVIIGLKIFIAVGKCLFVT